MTEEEFVVILGTKGYPEELAKSIWADRPEGIESILTEDEVLKSADLEKDLKREASGFGHGLDPLTEAVAHILGAF